MTPGKEMKAAPCHLCPSHAFSDSECGQGGCGKKASLGAEPTDIFSPFPGSEIGVFHYILPI